MNFKFPCSLTRNITSHSMENLGCHQLLRWKMIILPILTTSLIHFSLKGCENVLFELGSESVQRIKSRFLKWQGNLINAQHTDPFSLTFHFWRSSWGRRKNVSSIFVDESCTGLPQLSTCVSVLFQLDRWMGTKSRDSFCHFSTVVIHSCYSRGIHHEFFCVIASKLYSTVLVCSTNLQSAKCCSTCLVYP